MKLTRIDNLAEYEENEGPYTRRSLNNKKIIKPHPKSESKNIHKKIMIRELSNDKRKF